MMKRLLIVLICAICFISATAIHAAESRFEFIPASKLGPPPQVAVDAAKVFAEGEVLTFNGVLWNNWLECWGFLGANITIDVDAVTNQINSVGYKELQPKHIDNPYSMDEALEKVLSYLNHHKVDINGMNLEECKYSVDYPESGAGRYNFTWRRRSPQGVSLPCLINVNIRDDGTIQNYLHVDRPAEISLVPDINADTVIKKAIEMSGYSANARIMSLDLVVWWDRDAHQRLKWTIGLSPASASRDSDPSGSEYDEDAAVIYEIDAHTEEKLAEFRLGGAGDAGSHRAKSPNPVLLAQAKQLSSDLNKAEKVEILALPQKDRQYSGLYDPHSAGIKVSAVLSAKQKSRELKVFKSAMSSISKSPIDFAPMMGPSTWMKVYMPGGKDVYYCRYTAGSFGVCWKENLAARDKDAKAYDRARRVKGTGMINVGARVDVSFAGLIGEVSGVK